MLGAYIQKKLEPQNIHGINTTCLGQTKHRIIHTHTTSQLYASTAHSLCLHNLNSLSFFIP